MRNPQTTRRENAAKTRSTQLATSVQSPAKGSDKAITTSPDETTQLKNGVQTKRVRIDTEALEAIKARKKGKGSLHSESKFVVEHMIAGGAFLLMAKIEYSVEIGLVNQVLLASLGVMFVFYYIRRVFKKK